LREGQCEARMLTSARVRAFALQFDCGFREIDYKRNLRTVQPPWAISAAMGAKFDAALKQIGSVAPDIEDVLAALPGRLKTVYY
jgi:hypothetical protein